ncbi:MAG TPA: flagellar export chaperone FliS [Ilumatobacter sp.]|nr:flagellar export chaperone FliS [Ilumatobacter sp.]
MSTFADPRLRFSSDSLATLSGPRVVVMCFDRLDRDLVTAVDALATGDLYHVNAALTHAQDLLHELAGMLSLDAWEHAPTLAGVYDYVIRLLTAANVTKKISKVEEAQRLLGNLGDAFREAARVGATVNAAGAAGVSGPPAEAAAGLPGGFSAQA